MGFLFDFPKRFTKVGDAAQGAVDEFTWISIDASGSDAEDIPRGAGIFVRGWALSVDGRSGATSVVLQVDGERRYQGRVGLPRPDVAATLGNADLDRAGFEAIVPTGQLSGGRHELTICTVDSTSRQFAQLAARAPFSMLLSERDLPQGVTFGTARFDAQIDEISDLSQDKPVTLESGALKVSRGSLLRFRGWAYDVESQKPLSSIFILVDGRAAFEGKYGFERPDVAKARGVKGLTSVGFAVDLPTIELSQGPHRLEIVATSGEKDSLLRSDPVLTLHLREREARPRELDQTTAAFLDSVIRIEKSADGAYTPLRVKRDDELFVRGWAFDEGTNAPAAGVVLVVDDAVEVQAIYGLHRPDVAESLGNSALSRCGFTAEIPMTHVRAGRHSARCYVIASDGRGTLRTAQQFEFEVVE